jgi:hypothetical protein
MQLYNYVAGGPFPPSMPEGFNEHRFGHADVVIFALSGINDNDCAHHLARELQTDREFRGLVYSYSFENRDFLKCANFFRVPTFPSYIAVSYRAFREFLCIDSEMSHLEHYEHWRWNTYQPPYIRNSKKLQYAIINGDALKRSSSLHIEREILGFARLFCIGRIEEAEKTFLSVRSISKNHLDALMQSAQPQLYSTVITVLFTRPAWRHTEFERLLYSSFIKFGSITDDVLVRILYPSHISDEYAKRVKEYNIIKLPAAIFSHKKTGSLVMKVERDFFESISDLDKRLEFLISDIHRAIAAGHKTMAKRLVKDLMAAAGNQAVTLEEMETETENIVFQLRPKNVFMIRRMEGDIVARDKVQGNVVNSDRTNCSSE